MSLVLYVRVKNVNINFDGHFVHSFNINRQE